MLSLLSVEVFLRLLYVVYRYFLLLNQLRPGDIFTLCIGQQGYKIYMHMSYRKEMQNKIYMYMSYRKERQNSVVADPAYKTNEPAHDKTNKMTCALSEGSDQPRHPSSLIRVFAMRFMGG